MDVSAPGRQTGAAMASLMERIPLSQVFRTGYGKALELKWQVARWRHTAWFEKAGLPLTFWGETWLGTLGGLVVEKPLYFDNYRTGRNLYRDFKSLGEIEETGQTLSDILAVDDLLDTMSIFCKKDPDHLLTWQNLLMTQWAHSYLTSDDENAFDAQGRLMPIPKTQFKPFFNALFARTERSDLSRPARTDKAMKINFLNWLSDRSGQPPEVLTGRLGGVLDALFEQVDEEMGAVRPDDIDPRHLHLFRLS
jgi:hypothetical protein